MRRRNFFSGLAGLIALPFCAKQIEPEGKLAIVGNDSAGKREDTCFAMDERPIALGTTSPTINLEVL